MTLKELRERAGLSRAQVAKELDLDATCVTHWECDDWCPSRKYHRKLAELYKVSDQMLKEAVLQELWR